MKNILVPTDFSREAGFALEFAKQLAAKSGGKIHLINVVEIPVSAVADPMGAPVVQDWGAEFVKSITDINQSKLDKLLKSNPDLITGIEVGIMLNVVLDYVQDENIDLVVMGTKGATGLKEIFVGSNAEKVVRFAPCPVITVSHRAEIEDIDEIIFGLDLDGHEGNVVESLKNLQEELGATIHFIYINTPHVLVNEEEVLTKMRAFAEKHDFHDYDINVRKNTQRDSGIIEFAKEKSADMIAMASNRRRGLAHFFSGSLAEDIVNHAPMPVWTISLKDK